jgi:uncharacterized membrane protein
LKEKEPPDIEIAVIEDYSKLKISNNRRRKTLYVIYESTAMIKIVLVRSLIKVNKENYSNLTLNYEISKLFKAKITILKLLDLGVALLMSNSNFLKIMKCF